MKSKFWDIYREDLNRCRRLQGKPDLKEISFFSVGGGIFQIVNALTNIDHCRAFIFWFRLIQNSKNKAITLFAKLMKFRISRKYGIQIPSNTQIGPGFYIGHGIGIVVNSTAIIGKNCNISQFTTIGSNKGKAATIGDNVYIGPGVCIVEDVKIGNNVKIGAGTVVVQDVPDNATTVGNPNRIILKENE